MPAEHRIELSPNCSLTPRREHGWFVGSLAVGDLRLVAGFLAATRGLWPVLPFAGLEIGLLAWAVRASMLPRLRSAR